MLITKSQVQSQMNNTTIYVTRPDLPPLHELIPLLEGIWNSKILTNNGPLHQELEAALCEYLGVRYVSLFTNATLALVTALRALRITGEVITTPYSFVATSHSLLWNNITPVFVDIDPRTLNLDPAKIEAAITPNTTAILPVHCYGNPCDVEAIQRLADTYHLKVIYDAAHAFGVQYQGSSVLNHGDLSVLSFHATKVFNTFEGGAIVCGDAETKRHIDVLKNFGFSNETQVIAAGINAKMNEFQAAIGLLQLRRIDESLYKRSLIAFRYQEALASINGLKYLQFVGQATANYSYFPIFVDECYPLSRDALYNKLKGMGIYVRRYFYPLITEFPMYRQLLSASPDTLRVATSAAERILCLPIYPDLDEAGQGRVIDVLKAGQ